MPSVFRKFYRRYFKPVFISANLVLNKMGRKHKCFICGKSFSRFTKYGKGLRGLSVFLKEAAVTGSDLDNFGCIYCGATDRERHLFMFFDKLEFWQRFPGAIILHIAAEPNLGRAIKSLHPEMYIKGDLYPMGEEEIKINIMETIYTENRFDVIICNHVLEHVSDHRKAIAEIFRILKPGGTAILQTPYSNLLHKTFEDEGINTDYLRKFFYGQYDHLRLFGKRHLLDDLCAQGFILQISVSRELFDGSTADFYGVNNNEDLIEVLKPGRSIQELHYT